MALKKDGVQGQVYKHLRLAKYKHDATLDLHGQPLQRARSPLFKFIDEGHKRKIRVVL
ncbi:DNA endonuclease SmrA, partial [Pseudoalteromonas sp. S2721]